MLRLPVDQARRLISKVIWNETKSAYERAGLMSDLFGENAMDDVACHFLIALALETEPALIFFDEQAQSEEITLELPFVAIGSGYEMALPFLAFIKRVLWNELAPHTIADGVFGALWTVQHVIRVNSGLGVGGSPSIAILEKEGEAWHALMLDGHALDEHRLAIAHAENMLRRSRGDEGEVFNTGAP